MRSTRSLPVAHGEVPRARRSHQLRVRLARVGGRIEHAREPAQVAVERRHLVFLAHRLQAGVEHDVGQLQAAGVELREVASEIEMVRPRGLPPSREGAERMLQMQDSDCRLLREAIKNTALAIAAVVAPIDAATLDPPAAARMRLLARRVVRDSVRTNDALFQTPVCDLLPGVGIPGATRSRVVIPVGSSRRTK